MRIISDKALSRLKLCSLFDDTYAIVAPSVRSHLIDVSFNREPIPVITVRLKITGYNGDVGNISKAV